MAEDPPPLNPRALRQRLESLSAAGVTQLPRKVAAEKPTPVTALIESRRESPRVDKPSSTSQRSVEPSSVAASRPSAGSIAAAGTLEILQQQVAACTACDELARTRKQTVFGT
ncbi:MAG: hypothetical protein AAF266_16670, partial [Planctomycetota bacterium]